MHSYTPEVLISFLYKETSADTTAAIEDALSRDWTLREKLAVLKDSMERLNGITASPRTQAVLNILRYAARSEEPTPSRR